MLEEILQSDKLDDAQKEVIRKLIKENEELKAAFERFESVKSGYEKQIKLLDERIAKAKEEGKAELAQQLELERQQKQQITQELAITKGELLRLKSEALLLNAIKGYDLLSQDVVIDALRSKLTTDEDGNVLIEIDGQKMEVTEGVRRYLDAHPELLKALGRPGSGVGMTSVAQILNQRR